MPDDIAPIVVGGLSLLILFDQILLHLFHAGRHRSVFGNIFQLLVDDGVKLSITVGISIIRNLHRSVRTFILVEVESYGHAIRASFLLAH